jgi:hypothetical protein
MASKIKIGDRVRSFDFEGRDDSFVEGPVIGFDAENFDCKRYVIKCELSMFGGDPDPQRIGEIVYPPVNGTRTWMGGVTNCVKKVDEVEA